MKNYLKICCICVCFNLSFANGAENVQQEPVTNSLRIIMHGGISLFPHHGSSVHAIIDNATFVLSGCKNKPPLRAQLVLRNVSNSNMFAFASLIELHDSICATNTTVEGLYHLPGSSNIISFFFQVPLETLLNDTLQTTTLQVDSNSNSTPSSRQQPPLKIGSIAKMTGRSVSYKKFDLILILPPVETTNLLDDVNAISKTISTMETSTVKNVPFLLSRSPLLSIVLNETDSSISSTIKKSKKLIELLIEQNAIMEGYKAIEQNAIMEGYKAAVAIFVVIMIIITLIFDRKQSGLTDDNDKKLINDYKRAISSTSTAVRTSTSATKALNSTPTSRSGTQHSSPSRLSSADYDLYRLNPLTNTSTKLSTFTVNATGDVEKHIAASYKSGIGKGEDGTLYAVRTMKRSSKRKSKAPSPSRSRPGVEVKFSK
jgi:hypothetical protein